MQDKNENSNGRTLTNLLNLDRRVWLYIQNKAVWEIFCNQAEKEGFIWSDGRRMNFIEFDNIVVLNNDLSFNYVGCIGHIWFGNSEDTAHYKIDFAKYINGADDYFYEKPSAIPKMTEEEIKKRLTQRAWEYKMFEDD